MADQQPTNSNNGDRSDSPRATSSASAGRHQPSQPRPANVTQRLHYESLAHRQQLQRQLAQRHVDAALIANLHDEMACTFKPTVNPSQQQFSMSTSSEDACTRLYRRARWAHVADMQAAVARKMAEAALAEEKQQRRGRSPDDLRMNAAQVRLSRFGERRAAEARAAGEARRAARGGNRGQAWH